MNPEPHPQADEAARYVLGQLPPAARHQFEVQLAQSPELRALVQELEEGVEAAARAVPQRPPPPQAWSPIEQAIAREAERNVVTFPRWANWCRSGWAAAAACLLAFVGYAVWQSRNASSAASPHMADASHETQIEPPPANSTGAPSVTRPSPVRPIAVVTTQVVVAPTATPAEPDVINPELTLLRGQVAALQSQLEQLSQLVSQQKAIMAEPGRFKFFSMASNSVASGDSMPTQLSAGLQRAMFYAMARDLGWLPNIARPAPGQGNNASGSRAFNGVDFVDLNVSSENATASTTATETDSATEPVSIGSTGNIPGFTAGTNLVMAFDRSIITEGGSVGFWTTSPFGAHQFLGNAVLGENPLVVTVPADQVRNGKLVIVATPPSGVSNVVGQFFIVRYPPVTRPP